MTSFNPFREIIPIPEAEKLFQMAHNAVMKTSIRGTSENVPPLLRMRRKEATRIELLSKELRSRLFRIVEEFPQLDSDTINAYYVEILDLSYNINELKKTLGSITGTAEVIWKIKREHLGNAWRAGSVIDAKFIRRSAFGRMKSVIMQLNERLKFLEKVRQKMRLLPGIDLTQPIFCIAGYPNVGKSFLVNTITDATPEIGAYPFTTKEVTLGHLKIPIFGSKEKTRALTNIIIQIVDTPGILDRPLTERNQIELRALAAIKTLATAIVFIFDFTQFEALQAQINLYHQVITEFSHVPLLLIGSKSDILTKEQRTDFSKFWDKNFPQKEIKLLSMRDKETLIDIFINFFHSNENKIVKIMTQKVEPRIDSK